MTTYEVQYMDHNVKPVEINADWFTVGINDYVFWVQINPMKSRKVGAVPKHVVRAVIEKE